MSFERPEDTAEKEKIKAQVKKLSKLDRGAARDYVRILCDDATTRAMNYAVARQMGLFGSEDAVGPISPDGNEKQN